MTLLLPVCASRFVGEVGVDYGRENEAVILKPGGTAHSSAVHASAEKPQKKAPQAVACGAWLK
jgi:hypothetical protein